MTGRVTDEELTMLALKAQSRLIDVEKENESLRQLVKDLLAWTSEGFLLIGSARKLAVPEKQNGNRSIRNCNSK